MPVGGIMWLQCTSEGDGRLWLWDIFNKNQEGIEPSVVNYSANVLDGGKKCAPGDGAYMG